MTEEKIIEILKYHEQRDYANGGVSISPTMYFVIARKIVDYYKDLKDA